MYQCMLRLFLLLTSILVGTMAHGQKRKVVTLEPEIMRVESRWFYIEEVLDQREEENKMLGTVYTGLFGKPKKLVLLGGIEEGLEQYLQNALPRMNTHTPVKMIVEDLEVKEQKGATKKSEMTIAVRFMAGALESFDTQGTYQYNNAKVGVSYEDILKKTVRLVIETYAEDGPRPEN